MTPPADYTWITLLFNGLQILVPTIATAIAGYMISTRVKDVKTHTIEGNNLTTQAIVKATEAKDQAVETAKAVNGRMENLLTIAADKATAEATLAEKKAESERRAAASSAMPERRIGIDEVAAQARLDEARSQAHKVLDEAAAAAKKLIEDASQHKE